jgi:DNA-binding winged helix-turn-helix (wHTH) protein/Tfp pilus assembly protein PilF
MPTGQRHVRFGDFSLDTHTRELRGRDGRSSPLAAKAFGSLCLLIENRHRVVGQDELLASVWEGRTVDANNVNQAIGAVRRALRTNAADRRYIVTVPGSGYRFVADVQVESEGGAIDTDNPLAYRAWLRGYHLLQRPTRANLADALVAFRRAVDLDTSYTRAYAGMALAYRGLVHTDGEPHELFPLAKAAAARALTLEPESAEALMALGRIQHLYDWDWEAAAHSFERAIAANPTLMEVHFAYAHLLVDVGRFDQGLSHARRARDIDPLSPMVNAIEAGFHTAAQQPDQARRRVDRALELQPEFWVALMVRGGMALEQGDAAAAIADLETAADGSERASQILGLLATAYGAAGDRAKVLLLLNELEARAGTAYVPATSFAAVRNALGETSAALDLLERAYEQHDIRLAFLKVDARWNNLRAEPRFRALARTMGLGGDRAYGRF